ncbi:class 1 fructose-bisphosphatase [soil metagenome]
MTAYATLADLLAAEDAPEDLKTVVAAIAEECVAISRLVSLGALAGALGLAGGTNVQDEEQKKLDVMTNDMLTDRLKATAAVAAVGSEEMDLIEPTGRQGGYLVTFDPLDGSSNIDINAPVGTIFSILPAPEGREPVEADFLIGGRKQVCAGYAVYGSQTMLVLTLHKGVNGFTLDAEGVWRLTHPDVRVPAETKEFAINMSNRRHWAEPVRRYIDGCLAGKTGPRGKDFNMRWVAAMVADVHRIMMRGGVFLYPWDQREPDRPGKLRLLYEGAPMALLIERAGGKATTDGTTPILDVIPTRLHERVAVALGSANEIDAVAAA